LVSDLNAYGDSAESEEGFGDELGCFSAIWRYGLLEEKGARDFPGVAISS